jgi:hypothetical protein
LSACVLKVYRPNPGTLVPVKWSAEYIKHNFLCNNYFKDFDLLQLKTATLTNDLKEREGAGEELTAPEDASARIIFNATIKA